MKAKSKINFIRLCNELCAHSYTGKAITNNKHVTYNVYLVREMKNG